MLGIYTYITLLNSHKNHKGRTLFLCFKIEGSVCYSEMLFNSWMKDEAFKFSSDSFHCLSEGGYYCVYFEININTQISNTLLISLENVLEIILYMF